MKVQVSVDSEECDHCPFPDTNILTEVFESEIESLWPQAIVKPEIVEISISTLSSSDMKEQNKMYRDVDSSTDVLSFPMWESNGEFVPAPITGCPVFMLGDVLLCPEKIRENADENGKGYFEELCLVLAHSFLHLLAFDHETPENEENMWSRQEIIKNKIIGELHK